METYSPYYPTGSSVHTQPLPFSLWSNVGCAETHRLPNNPRTGLSKVCNAFDHWSSLVGGTWRVRPHSLLKPRSNSKWNTICGDFGHSHSLSVIHQSPWIPSCIAFIGEPLCLHLVILQIDSVNRIEFESVIFDSVPSSGAPLFPFLLHSDRIDLYSLNLHIPDVWRRSDTLHPLIWDYRGEPLHFSGLPTLCILFNRVLIKKTEDARLNNVRRLHHWHSSIVFVHLGIIRDRIWFIYAQCIWSISNAVSISFPQNTRRLLTNCFNISSIHRIPQWFCPWRPHRIWNQLTDSQLISSSEGLPYVFSSVPFANAI